MNILSPHFFKISTFLIISCVLIISCNADHDHGNDHNDQTEKPSYEKSTNSDANIKLVNDYLAAVLAADGEKIRSMVNEDFISYGPSANDSATIDQVITSWTTVNEARSNQDAGVGASNSIMVHEGNLAGDWANVWGEYTATDNATGYKFRVPWHAWYRIENGKISATGAYFDNLAPSLATGAAVAASPAE